MLFSVFQLAAQTSPTGKSTGTNDNTQYADRKIEDSTGRLISDPAEAKRYLTVLEKRDASRSARVVAPQVAVELCNNGNFEEFESISGSNYLKNFRYTWGEPSSPTQCKVLSVQANNAINQYNPALYDLMANTVPAHHIDEFIGNINAFDQYALMVNYKNSGSTLGLVQAKRFKTNNETQVKFNYKAVLQSIPDDAGHIGNQPYFKARILNKNGVEVSQFCLIAEKTNCIFSLAPYLEAGEIVLYTPNWQAGYLDISSIPNNEEFTIEFMAARCGLSAHFGYTYIDDICLLHTNENLQGSIELDPLYKICPTLPVSVCGNFTLPASGGASASVASLVMTVSDATGTPVYTSNTPVINQANHTFCFDIAAANLPNIATGNYNVGVTVNYGVVQTACSGTDFMPATDPDANPGWDISFMNCTPNCSFTLQPGTLTRCDTNDDGHEIFDLSQANSLIAGTQNGLTFAYFDSLANATANTNAIAGFAAYQSASGTIYVRVSEGAGCFKIIAVSLVVKNPSVTISGVLNVCSGSTTLTASSGSSYLWSGGETSQSVTVSATGTYSVTVTDATGCSSSASVTISPSSVAVQPNLNVTQPNCLVDTGTIEITTPGSQYSFDNGATWTTNPIKSNLAVGSYNVKVQTVSGCISYPVVVPIYAFHLAFPTFVSVNPAFCGGFGSITITTAGAEYSFDDGATWGTSNTAQNLAPGVYNIRIKNQFGCISNFNTVELTSEFLPEATYTSVDPICDLGGSITITTPAAEFSFDGGLTWSANNVADNLTEGNYAIKVKNDLGCTSPSVQVQLTDFSSLYPDYTVVQPTCGTNGSITITTASDFYSFDNGVTWSASNTLSLPPGTYYIKIKNSQGCVSRGEYVHLYVFHMPAPDSTIIQPGCGNGGTITITTVAAEYSFDGGTTWVANSVASNLPVGSYEIMVRNGVDCVSYEDYIYLYEIFLPSPDYTAIQPTCETSGSITITTPGAQYSFDDGVTWLSDPVATGLPAGYYQIRIKDTNGCVSSSNYVYLYNAYLPDVTYTVVHPFCLETTGIITIDPVTGYEYSFNNGSTYQASNISDPLLPGTYRIKVRNAFGCESYSQYVYINPPSGIPAAPTGNPAQLYCIFNNPTISFLEAAGQNLQWYGSAVGGTPIPNDTPLTDGATYYGTQTVNTCESQVRFAVTVTLSDFVIPATDYTTLVCDDLNDGTQTVSLPDYNANIVANTIDYTFTYYHTFAGADTANPADLISGPNTFQIIPGGNTVYVRCEYTNGCWRVGKLVLDMIAAPKIVMPDKYILCQNSIVALRANMGFDSYLWSTGETTSTIVVGQPGNYIVTVTENHGSVICSSTKTIVVQLSNPATIYEVNTSDWTDNDNVIAVEVTATSIGDYEYSLDGVHYQDSNHFYDLNPGPYTVYVRDKNGCGTVIEDTYLLMYPRFFTPNGDGFNDTWQIKFSLYEPDIDILIFDRHGKFIKQLKYNEAWDGTYNGEMLPSTDYWFLVTRADGKEYRGHFSMKR